MYMDQRTFCEALLSLLKYSLPEGTHAELQSIPKNNGIRLNGITILSEDCPVAPTIYMDPFYEAYRSGAGLPDLAEGVLAIYHKSRPEGEVDLSPFTDFEKAKDRIVYKLVNRRRNRELLRTVPHVPFLDLEIVFCCLLAETEGGSATILIREIQRRAWGVSTEELLALAGRNTLRLLSTTLTPMEELLRQMQAEGKGLPVPLFVLSNRLNLYGASSLLYQNVLEEAAGLFGSGFYVLPASIHEVILMPGERGKDPGGLLRIVQDVNASHIQSEEVLSDRVYYYSPSSRRLAFLGSAGRAEEAVSV